MDHTIHPSPARGAGRPRREDLGLSRRDFLRLVGLTTTVGLSGLTLATCSLADIGSAITTAIARRPVRREMLDPAAATDLATYAAAVAKMQELDKTNSNDKRGWTQQMNIHLNHCKHADWLLLPWHRAYLYYFEQICRELTGVASFALPYWNWSLHQRIPAPFWDPSSPLYWSKRDATASSALSALAVGSSALDAILSLPNFLDFAGDHTTTYDLLEAGPHNYVHNFVGGTMLDFHSPLDPIFWTHHGRIDELWVEWNILRDHPNTNDPDWMNAEFTEFVDGQGNPVSVDVQTTILLPVVAYQYDTQIGSHQISS